MAVYRGPRWGQGVGVGRGGVCDGRSRCRMSNLRNGQVEFSGPDPFYRKRGEGCVWSFWGDCTIRKNQCSSSLVFYNNCLLRTDAFLVGRSMAAVNSPHYADFC